MMVLNRPGLDAGIKGQVTVLVAEDNDTVLVGRVTAGPVAQQVKLPRLRLRLAAHECIVVDRKHTMRRGHEPVDPVVPVAERPIIISPSLIDTGELAIAVRVVAVLILMECCEDGVYVVPVAQVGNPPKPIP